MEKLDKYNGLVNRMYDLIRKPAFEKNTEKMRLLQDVVNFHLDHNDFYRKVVSVMPVEGDVENIKEPQDVPSLPTNVFKKSVEKYANFVTVKELPFEYYMSSATSGDPSLVARTEDDKRIMQSVYYDRYVDFLGEDGFGEIVFAFAPPHYKLPRIQVSRIYEKINEETPIEYLVELDETGAKVVPEMLLKELPKLEKSDTTFTVGGSVPILYYALLKFKENGLKWDFDGRCKVVVGAGGWDGNKGNINLPPIPKKGFVDLMYELFRTPSEKIVDGYATSEISVFFPGHWSEEHNDFLYHTPIAYGDILIKDPENYEIIEGEGARGLLNIISPLAPTTAGTNSLVVSDIVELVAEDKCDECGRKGPVFKYVSRDKTSYKTGCGAVILKYLKEI